MTVVNTECIESESILYYLVPGIEWFACCLPQVCCAKYQLNGGIGDVLFLGYRLHNILLSPQIAIRYRSKWIYIKLTFSL